MIATARVLCPTCKALCVIRPAGVVYGEAVDCRRLANRKVLICSRWPHCDTYCSATADGVPLGTPAGPQLRRLRMRAHLALDPFWRSGATSRGDVYAWLAKKLRLPIEQTHIGHFDTGLCGRVIELCAKRRAVA